MTKHKTYIQEIQQMFDPSKFTTPAAKPLPVVLLLDVSSSMSGDKIDSLNQSVAEMIEAFSQEEKMETEIIVSIITFGSTVNLHLPFTKASSIQWTNLSATGMTPMGTALKMAKAMIEDKETTPSRAYRPTVILVSDGEPNDPWEQPLDDFVNQGRSSKCDRMAIAIGQGADQSVLKKFIAGTSYEVFFAKDASQLHEYFKKITMSVTVRSKSQNPNIVPDPATIRPEPRQATAQHDTTPSSDRICW
jgi:uncharacterized protein YegL